MQQEKRQLNYEQKNPKVVMEKGLSSVDQDAGKGSKNFTEAMQILVDIKECNLETLAIILYDKKIDRVRHTLTLEPPKYLESIDDQVKKEQRLVRVL